MLRNFIALTSLALAGALLLPEPSWAGFGGVRSGGMRAGGVRALVIIHRNAHAGILRQGPRFGHAIKPVFRPATHVRIPPSATSAANYLSRIRASHRAYLSGWSFPITTYGDTGYIGTPYDPGEAIPVYAPYPPDDPPAPIARPLLPRLSNATAENANPDACRSERVTVPASEGEREITVVRC